MKILVLGDGRLATEIIRQAKWHSISRKKDKIDIRDIATYVGFIKNYDTVLNCIGYTNTYDPEREQHWNINYKAIADLADYCEAFHKKLIHISTDFIYANSDQPATEDTIPIHASNWYSYSKLLADAHIQMRMMNYLLIRGSFKSKPFPYEKAFINISGNFVYTDIFADLIIKLIKKGATGIYNVGSSQSHTMYELAIETKPDVIGVVDWIDDSMPESVEMDVSKMNNFLGIE